MKAKHGDYIGLRRCCNGPPNSKPKHQPINMLKHAETAVAHSPSKETGNPGTEPISWMRFDLLLSLVAAMRMRAKDSKNTLTSLHA